MLIRGKSSNVSRARGSHNRQIKVRSQWARSYQENALSCSFAQCSQFNLTTDLFKIWLKYQMKKNHGKFRLMKTLLKIKKNYDNSEPKQVTKRVIFSIRCCCQIMDNFTDRPTEKLRDNWDLFLKLVWWRGITLKQKLTHIKEWIILMDYI